MSTPSTSLCAALAYLVSASVQYLNLSRKLTIFKVQSNAIGVLALVLHGYVLYRWIDTPVGQNLSLSHVFSLVSWLTALATFSTMLIKPIENLLLIILPINAFSILLGMFFPGENIFQTREHPSSLIHILISVVAFGILGMATIQAALIYLQNRLLRSKSTGGFIKLLPPLQTMETLLFQTIWSGFILLSVSLASAFLLLEGLFVNHLQKIILSLLAWGLFATLLYGHHQSGLRGAKAIRLTLIAVGLLIGAYLAGKFLHSKALT